MAENYKYIISSGVIVPDTSLILGEVQDAYRAAFGADLVVTPDTPQGVLITAQALARNETVNNNAALANQINPNIAGGIFLDAIMALTGIQRRGATKTIVRDVLMTGIPGTLISAGAQAQNTTGQLFELQSGVVIDGAGNATGVFASVDFGPIAAPINTLNQIVTAVLGWETVNNPVAGVLGLNEQSDVSARAFRLNTLAFQGVALPIAITSALYNVTGVQSLWFQENIAATEETINGITMDPHSIYVCVNGGSDLDVAAALLENKSLGCGWNGSTEVEIIEPVSGQVYEVKFDRPTPVPVLIKVTISSGDPDSIKSAILAYVSGEIDGETGFVVGSDVSPFEIAGAISTLFPGTFMTKVEVSYDDPVSYTTNTLAIEVDEIATTELSAIQVVSA